MNLLELPDCILEEIFLHLSYDEIAKKRLVSKKIDIICQSLLNRSVNKIVSRLNNRIETLKPLLPRKQSQRWNHTAQKEINCLESFASSVRQLSFVYKDFIEKNLCCFIPGKVIDISLSLLKQGTFSWSFLFDHNSVELKDAICMAKEHFLEQIQPNLQKLINASKLRRMHVNNSMPVQSGKQIKSIPSIPKATKSADPTPIAVQQNSKKSQIQDRGNCWNAYLQLNQKFISTNKKYDDLLRKVNVSNKAIKKELTDSRQEVANLRRRLEKYESQNPSVIAEQTHLVTKRDIKKVLRSSKRLTDDKESENQIAIGKRTGASHTKTDHSKVLRSSKMLAVNDENRSANGERTDENHLVGKSNIKKALRSSKRLAEKKKND